MKRTIYIWLSLLLLLPVTVEAKGVVASIPEDPLRRSADSIMEKVIFYAPLYEKIVESYKAELYVKGRVNIRKKNGLIRFIPSMFRVRKGVDEYLMESYSDLNFTAPDIYDQKLKAGVGTSSEFWELDGNLPQYFHINVYSSTLLYDKLLSPLAKDAKKFYKYRLDSVWGEDSKRHYRIRFMPRNKSYQLVGGYLVVSDRVWSVREMRFSGRSEMVRFNNLVRMGEVGADDEFLPRHFNVEASFRFLGNRMGGNYTAVLKYKEIKHHDPATCVHIPEKNRYDLSESYTLRTDTNTFKRDTVSFNALRPLPLTHHEESLYDDYFARNDTLSGKYTDKKRARVFWGQIGDALVNRYTVDFSKYGTMRCSPLINPLLLSYSGKNGLSYRQEFKYNRLFSGDRLLRVVPRIGYNFKQKQFYWRIRADFDYLPRKRSALHLEVGRGNRIYTSEVLDDLKSMPDSIFDFSQIHLDYFNDIYLKLRHSWEIVNGLTLDVGLSMHHRTEVERSRFIFTEEFKPVNGAGELLFDPSLLRKFRHTYNSFAPRVRLSWTPGQYYYMSGLRKVNLHSRYPTFSVDWERGVDGVLGSTGNYERVEVDVQHNVHLGMLRDFYYRIGWGAFTNQKEIYFVDFANFTRSALPMGWNDEIGGVFQLLDGRWYNSSRKYLRAHLTYEAPFFLLPHLSKYTQYVLNERIYLNLLAVPHLKPYIEVGYGIGTHIFDFGLFGSFGNWKFREVGCKFTFELFNR